MMIGFQKLKWMLCFALLPATPALSSHSTRLLRESVPHETSNPTDIKTLQKTRRDLSPAQQEGDSGNVPVLKNVVRAKNLSFRPVSTRIPPRLGQIPEDLKDLPPEKPLPALGQISEGLRQIILEKDPHIPEELPENLTDSSIGEILPPIGKRPEEWKDAPQEKIPPSFSRNMNVLDTLISAEKHNQETQAVTQLLMQAIERDDSEHYRILIKYILMSYNPIQVLSILHSVQEKSENTLVHLLAKTASGKLIHDLRNLMETFLPFVRRQGFFSEIRAPFIPEEFRKTSPEEPGDGNLWALETPIDLENMTLVQVLQRDTLPAYHKELISELLKPGNMKRFLAALHGNTQTGKSLYDFMEDAQSNKAEFAREAEALAKWFTLPLHRTNRAGLTPLLIARNIFKKKGRSEAFVILSTAETGLGMSTAALGKKPRGMVLGISCLFSFQNME